MSWFITNLIGAILLPPLIFLLPGALGLLWWQKTSGRWLVACSLAGLWLCATPYVADAAMHWLEGEPKALDVRIQSADAIVVLGCGTYFSAPDYDGDTVSPATLERVRYAAHLYHLTGKPVLTSGGTPMGNQRSEARQMQEVLAQEFNVPVQWTENSSNNTAENARDSKALLQAQGIRRIYLVSHAWHLPRARHAFEAVGFEVVPAPTAFTTRSRTSMLTFLPEGAAMQKSQIFVHELIGLLWYRLKSAH